MTLGQFVHLVVYTVHIVLCQTCVLVSNSPFDFNPGKQLFAFTIAHFRVEFVSFISFSSLYMPLLIALLALQVE